MDSSMTRLKDDMFTFDMSQPPSIHDFNPDIFKNWLTSNPARKDDTFKSSIPKSSGISGYHLNGQPNTKKRRKSESDESDIFYDAHEQSSNSSTSTIYYSCLNFSTHDDDADNEVQSELRTIQH